MPTRACLPVLSTLLASALLLSCTGPKDPGTSPATVPSSPMSAGPAKPAPGGPAAEPVDKLVDEVLQCPRLVHDRATGQPIVKMDQYVDLRLEKGTFHFRIHIPEATSDLTFGICTRIPRPAPGVSHPFVMECSKLEGIDGAQFSIDAHLVEVAASVSSLLLPGTGGHREWSEVAKKVGRDVPRRTLVFTAGGRKVMEFLCYP